MGLTLIGDCHGHFDRYKTILKSLNGPSIQVGDMGIGFPLRGAQWDDTNSKLSAPSYDIMKADNHRFIRGNHDNPAVCKKHSQWIPDGTVEGNMMMVGGAFSIDFAWRTEGVSWWKDEELTYDQADEVLGKYLIAKPHIMITHDCPVDVIPFIHSHHLFDNSFTQRYLQNMFDQHQPSLWVFGHHHVPFDMTINGTMFKCLPELETMEI